MPCIECGKVERDKRRKKKKLSPSEISSNLCESLYVSYSSEGKSEEKLAVWRRLTFSASA